VVPMTTPTNGDTNDYRNKSEKGRRRITQKGEGKGGGEHRNHILRHWGVNENMQEKETSSGGELCFKNFPHQGRRGEIRQYVNRGCGPFQILGRSYSKKHMPEGCEAKGKSHEKKSVA